MLLTTVTVFFTLKKKYFIVFTVTQLHPMSEQSKSKCDFGFEPANIVQCLSDFISPKSAVFKFVCT